MAWHASDPHNAVVTRRSTITFRSAGPDDAPFLAEMLLEAVNWHPERRMSMTQVLATPALAHYVAGWPRPGDGGVIAVASQRPIGAAWWRFFPEDDPGYGFVSATVPELSIAVVAHWRGRGVGRALLREAIAAAADQCRQMSLSVERAAAAGQPCPAAVSLGGLPGCRQRSGRRHHDP